MSGEGELKKLQKELLNERMGLHEPQEDRIWRMLDEAKKEFPKPKRGFYSMFGVPDYEDCRKWFLNWFGEVKKQ